MPAAPRTRRQADKQRRYRELLEAAARLFGTHGYASVALDDIGSEVGVSGQAIYRHFRGKQDLLGTLLLETSAALLDGGRQIRSDCPDPHERMERLIAFHVEFALNSPEIIRVQDQEMPQLVDADRRRVRRMQREYLEIFSETVRQLHPRMTPVELRTRVHGIFGLINSTAHSVTHSYRQLPSPQELAESAPVLQVMARAAVDAPLREG